MSDDLTGAPTRDELEAAYRLLCKRGVEVICDRSLSCVAEVVRGNPPHAPDRYSAAEVAFAKAVLVLRAEVERSRVAAGKFDLYRSTIGEVEELQAEVLKKS